MADQTIEDNTQDCHGCGETWHNCQAVRRDIGDACCLACDHRDPNVHDITVTPSTELDQGVSPIDLAFRMGEAFGSINAKLDRLLRLYGIDPDGEEVRRAVEEAKSRLTITAKEG